jgi:hypothetical protein
MLKVSASHETDKIHTERVTVHHLQQQQQHVLSHSEGRTCFSAMGFDIHPFSAQTAPA